MAPTYTTAYNPTDAPVVVDTMGRTVGGGEWAAVRRGQLVDDAGNRGQLIVVTSVNFDDASHEATVAARQAEEWNGLADKWRDTPVDRLRDAAAAADLEPLEDADRADLVDLLVRAGVKPSTRRPAKPAPTDDDQE